MKYLFLIWVLVGCGHSDAAKRCRQQRTTTASHARDLIQILEEKRFTPKPVEPQAPPRRRATDPELAAVEDLARAIGEIVVAHHNVLSAEISAEDALRPSVTAALKAMSATLEGDDDPKAATQAVVAQIDRYESVHIGELKRIEELSTKAKALVQQVDALVATTKNPDVKDDLEMQRRLLDATLDLLKTDAETASMFKVTRTQLADLNAACK